MARKGISEFVYCVRCGGAESLLHDLRDCPWVKEVWDKVNTLFPSEHVSSFKDIFDRVWCSNGAIETENLVMLYWQNIHTPHLLCIRRGLDWLSEYQYALSFQSPEAKQSRQKACWVGPPPIGVIKINFDGECGSDREKVGLGFVARDHSGRFLLAGSRTISLVGFAEDSKCHALYWALSVARAQGWEHVILEGDCQEIIGAMSRKKHRSFHVQVVVDNCILSCNSFQSCVFMFFFRECNSVAHGLARWVVASV